MKMYTKGLSMLLAVSITAGSGAYAMMPSFANDSSVKPEIAICPPYEAQMLQGHASIKEVLANGNLLVSVDGQEVVLKLNEETYLIHAKTGLPVSSKDFKAKDALYVYYSPVMTRSLPPQSNAIAVVTGVEKDKTFPRLFTVKEIVSEKDTEVRVLNTEGDLIVTLTKDTPVSPFKTKQMVNFSDVKVGTQIFVWYDIVAMSYPGQTGATKAVILGQCEEAQSPELGVAEVKATQEMLSKLKLNLNGKAISAKLELQNGHVMVPLRQVAKELGFKIQWDADIKGVHLDDGSVKTDVVLGEDGYFKASSKAIGLTQMFELGAKPEMKNGTLYVPVSLFNLLYSNNDAVRIEGNTLSIRK